MEPMKITTSVQSVNGTAVTNPSMIRVTPDMAAQWLETMKYEHQRAVRQHHVDFLAEEMRRNRFVQGTQIRFVLFNGDKSLVDGQHRLWAVVTANMPQYFTVLTTRVESKEEAAWIYGSLDVNLKRTGADLYGALELEQELQVTKTELRLLNGAVGFMATGCLRSVRDLHRDDAVRYMRLYAPYARQYFDLLAGSEQTVHRSITRAASLSIALLTFRFALPRAESRGDPSILEFWRGVAFDDGIQIGDPRKTANRHLLNTGMMGGGVTVANRSGSHRNAVVSPAYSSRILVACFNAYMERRDLKQAKVFDAHAPIDLYAVSKDPTDWW